VKADSSFHLCAPENAVATPSVSVGWESGTPSVAVVIDRVTRNLAALPPGNRCDTTYAGGCVGCRIGQQVCGKFRHQQNSIPESHPVASRHTDCPVPAHKNTYTRILIHISFCVINVVVPAFRPHFGLSPAAQAWFRQYTPPENKNFREYFMRLISFKYFKIYDETIRECVLRSYVDITFYTQFEIIQDSTT
jgi:hypothetical protein